MVSGSTNTSLNRTEKDTHIQLSPSILTPYRKRTEFWSNTTLISEKKLSINTNSLVKEYISYRLDMVLWGRWRMRRTLFSLRTEEKKGLWFKEKKKLLYTCTPVNSTQSFSWVHLLFMITRILSSMVFWCWQRGRHIVDRRHGCSFWCLYVMLKFYFLWVSTICSPDTGVVNVLILNKDFKV